MDIKYSLNQSEINDYKYEYYLPYSNYLFSFWFLTDLNEAIKKNYVVKIMINYNKEDYNIYKVKDYTLRYLSGNEGKSDSIFLIIEGIQEKKIRKINIKNIKNITPGIGMQGKSCSYYVDSDTNECTFDFYYELEYYLSKYPI